MATFTKVLLSGSTQGMPIKIAATATVGTSIHATGTSATTIDEIWLWATNTSASDVVLTIEYGSATAPDGNIIQTITAKAGEYLIVPGLVLTGSGAAAATVKAFAATANVITIAGFVNRIA